MLPLAGVLLPLLMGVAQPPMAKRLPPPKVAPVTLKGVTFRAPNEDPLKAIVTADQADSGRRLWEVTVFETGTDAQLEQDVQWVFITRLRVKGEVLEVRDELGRIFRVDLRSRKVTRRR